MNRRQLLSLVALPLVPKTLNATDPVDKPKNYPLFISGHGNPVPNGLAFLIDVGNYKLDFNISKLLAKIFPYSSYGSIRVEYMNLQNQEALVTYTKFAQTAKYYICYSTHAKTLTMLTAEPGMAYLSRYNKNGIRIK